MGLFTDPSGKWSGFTDRTKYVNDFRTELVTDKNGKTRKKVTYHGPWTVLKDTGTATLVKLIAAAVLAVLNGVFLVWAMLTTHASSGSYLVIVPLAAALFPSLYLLYGAAALPYRRQPMRRDQYMHGIARMQRSSLAAGVFAIAAVLMSILYRIIHSDWMFMSGDRLFLIRVAAAIACCAGILILFRNIDTDEKPNEMYGSEIKTRLF